MIDYDNITAVAKELRETYGVISAWQLCEAFNIGITCDLAMGKGTNDIRGFMMKWVRSYTIVLNSDLTAFTKEIVLYHEIGHLLLHHMERFALKGFRENDMYSSAQWEIEANCFVAEYLMDTEETLDLIQEGRTFECIAKLMGVPPEIADFKFRMLKHKKLLDNYEGRYSSNCMGKIDCGLTHDDFMD